MSHELNDIVIKLNVNSSYGNVGDPAIISSLKNLELVAITSSCIDQNLAGCQLSQHDFRRWTWIKVDTGGAPGAIGKTVAWKVPLHSASRWNTSYEMGRHAHMSQGTFSMSTTRSKTTDVFSPMGAAPLCPEQVVPREFSHKTVSVDHIFYDIKHSASMGRMASSHL